LTQASTVVKPYPRALPQESTPCILILNSRYVSEAGNVHPVTKDELVVGRDEDADIRVTDPGVSRRHAKILRQGARVVFEDLGSRNGSRVNGNLVVSRELLDGDTVHLGTEAAIRFVLQDSMEVRYAMLLEETREAVRLRDEFLSIASHELNTPITALGLQLYSLRKLTTGLAIPPEVRSKMFERMNILERQTKRLGVLTSQLLDVSRVRLGQMDLLREPVDLLALLQEHLTLSQEDFHQAGCSVSLAAAAHPRGLWDPMRMGQVIANLLSNARRYGQGKPVHLSVGMDPDCAVLKVSDRGIGIAAADQVRIFERFERAASSRNFGGLGLGLYITRTIVEAHGGTIDVQSQLGSGATFVVRLPLEP
jgi:signal transduction histidine kinase